MAAEENLNTRRWRAAVPYVTALAGTAVVAALGGSATVIDAWYAALAKPWFQPPDCVFPVAWTSLYVLFTIAIGTGWNRMSGLDQPRRALLILLLVNAVLNVGWSVLFFYLRRPDWALMEIVPFWLFTLLPFLILWRHARASALLFAPYLVWVSFAAVLNFAIVALNGPFG